MASLLGRSEHLPLPPTGPENRTRILLEMGVALPIIAALFVCARCCSARQTGRKLALDDVLLIAATILLLVQGGMLVAGCRLGLLGLKDVYIGEDALHESYKFVLFLQTSYIFSISFAKISIAFFELRLFSNQKTHRRILWCSIALIAISTIVAFCFLLFRCSPLEKFWNWNVEGTCAPALDGAIIVFVFSGIHVLLDFLYAGLPMFIVWNLQLSRGLKIQLSILFGLVLMATIATIGRSYYLRKLVVTENIIWSYNSMIAWSLLELTLSIVTASVCTLRPCAQKIFKIFRTLDWKLFKGHHFRKLRGGNPKPKKRSNDIETGISPEKDKDLSATSSAPDVESPMTPYTEDAKILQLPGAAILSSSRFSDFSFGLPSARTPSSVNSRGFIWPDNSTVLRSSTTFNDRVPTEEALWSTTCTTTISAGSPLPRRGLKSIMRLHRHPDTDTAEPSGTKPTIRTRYSRGSLLSTATLRSLQSPSHPKSILSSRSSPTTTTDISLDSISPIDDTTTLAPSKCSSEQDTYFTNPSRRSIKSTTNTSSHRHSHSSSSGATKITLAPIDSKSHSQSGPRLVTKEQTKEPVHVRFGDANGVIHRTTDVVVVSRRKESLVREMMKLIS